MNHPSVQIPERFGQLLARVCHAHRNKAQALLSEIDLYAGQEFVLARLWEQDGLSQSELAEHLCVQPATVTRMIGRMASAGFIDKRTDPDDQRVSRIYLTAAGRAQQGPVDAVWEALEDDTLANMTLEERVLLRRLLIQVLQNLS